MISKKHIQDHNQLVQWLEQNLDLVEIFADEIWKTLEKGGKIILAGNGGSASDAQHFAAELVGRFEIQRKAYPAIALGTNISTVTAVSNDYEYNHVFVRELEAIASSDDLFIPISTSGNSENVLQACHFCKDNSIPMFALLGRDGGKIRDLADNSIIIPSEKTARIQEMHIFIAHLICSIIDEYSK